MRQNFIGNIIHGQNFITLYNEILSGTINTKNVVVICYKILSIPGADPAGVHPERAPPKIGKKYDFSHEIPQKCSRLPPQLEKITFFGIKS